MHSSVDGKKTWNIFDRISLCAHCNLPFLFVSHWLDPSQSHTKQTTDTPKHPTAPPHPLSKQIQTEWERTLMLGSHPSKWQSYPFIVIEGKGFGGGKNNNNKSHPLYIHSMFAMAEYVFCCVSTEHTINGRDLDAGTQSKRQRFRVFVSTERWTYSLRLYDQLLAAIWVVWSSVCESGDGVFGNIVYGQFLFIVLIVCWSCGIRRTNRTIHALSAVSMCFIVRPCDRTWWRIYGDEWRIYI